jgi:hypothetical protein
MNTWKTKLFGDNRLNFYGWIVTGLLIFGASLWYVIRAINLGAGRSPSGLLLIAIFFVLLGHFGIALTNYCARVAKTLEAQDAEKDSKPTI